ncbi:P-loop containing nucleoside triphosphate hydrolase protein [Mycena vulgaris]|nr:P-loop containing nucleoside triphosphate hydrolase protein [Mycena vulgaris]
MSSSTLGTQPPWLTSFMALSSVFATLGLLSQAYLGSSIKLLILGSIIEAGRRIFQWLIVRLQLQYSITAEFHEGDPAYEWIVLFLTQENVWRRSRKFKVTATNSRRKWSVKAWVDPTVKGNAEYVPTYQEPQLFRWRGHWLEIKRTKDGGGTLFTPAGEFKSVASIYVSIYTLDMKLLSELVEDAHARYVEINRPNVIIHLADTPGFASSSTWNYVKHKIRRPLSSIILPEGVVDALIRDAQEFFDAEDWYQNAGIPHHRGYLLHGPPGTGKTSTIYALAGALNLEIYSLSLASSFVDDSFLQRAASAIPKKALFLIEDIDCAFPSRDDADDMEGHPAHIGRGQNGELVPPGAQRKRSAVTLSGLLNVIDGVGSEEGKLFFATTNYIDRLDPALLRPGRIDRKVAYELATETQARALFLRFFPASAFSVDGEASQSPENPADATNAEAKLPIGAIPDLAAEFAAAIPPAELSTAELQGYLQSHKTSPSTAVEGARAWVADIREERRAREAREAERKRRVQERRAQMRGAMGPVGTVVDTVGERPAGSTSGSESDGSSYVDGALPAEEQAHVE